MDKNSFADIMERPGALTPDEWESLRFEKDRYPFSAPLQVMSLLADKANGAPLWEKQALPLVSLYVQDAGRLYEQVTTCTDRPHEPEVPEAPAPSVVSATPSQPPLHHESPESSARPGNFDILKEINDYQEVSFKTAPKSVILSNFLEKDGGIVPDFNTYNDVSVQELAKKSILPSGVLGTETLAVILEKQGKLAQALAIYEKLMVDNPEKSSTFAVRIAEIKARINEIKK